MVIYKKWKFRTYADDIFGNRKQFERKGFSTKKEAKLADRSDHSNVTLNDVWIEYKDEKKLKLKPQSFRTTVSRFENHILPYSKDYKLNNINNSVSLKWQREIEKKGFRHKYNSSLHRAMVNILNYAIKFYGLKENVASLTGNFKKKTELTKKVYFRTYEEYQRFIEVVNDLVYKTLFETLYYTGLRQGEALAPNWNDFKDNCLNINKTISKGTINNAHIINFPKTVESIRKVKLDDEESKI